MPSSVIEAVTRAKSFFALYFPEARFGAILRDMGEQNLPSEQLSLDV